MKRERAGIAFMIIGALVFSAMNIFVKISVKQLSFLEVIFIANAFSSIALMIHLKRRHVALLGTRSSLMVARGFFGFLALAAYYYTMSRITIADTVILNKVSPIFVMLLAYFLLKESLSKWQILILFTSLIGVFNIIQPQMQIDPFAGAIGLSSALSSAVAYTLVKNLSTDHQTLQIVFAYVTIVALLALIWGFPMFTMPSLTQLAMLIVIGISSTGGQLLMTKAYSLGSATSVSIASYGTVLFSSLFGYIFLGELQNTQALIGSIIVIGSLCSLPFVRLVKQEA